MHRCCLHIPFPTCSANDIPVLQVPWTIDACGPCIAFVRNGKIAVDEWEMYLREAFDAVQLLDNSLEGLLERQLPIENPGGTDIQSPPSVKDRIRMWGSETEAMAGSDRETRPTAVSRASSIDTVARAGHFTPDAIEPLQVEEKESIGMFAAIDSLVDSASQKATLQL